MGRSGPAGGKQKKNKIMKAILFHLLLFRYKEDRRPGTENVNLEEADIPWSLQHNTPVGEGNPFSFSLDLVFQTWKLSVEGYLMAIVISP